MASLAAVINRMLASLEEARNEREKAEVKIRWLARFPEESPAPILRLSDQAEVLYSNLPGLEMLRELAGGPQSVGFVLEDWKAVIARVLEFWQSCRAGVSGEWAGLRLFVRACRRGRVRQPVCA